MILPDVIIYDSVRSLIRFTRQDLLNNADKETFLWFIFGKDDNGKDLKIDTFNHFQQSKALFGKGKDKQRELDVFKSYNFERHGIPTIHIMMPNENMYFAGIGESKGYDEDIITES